MVWIQVTALIVGLIIVAVVGFVSWKIREGGKRIAVKPNMPICINFSRTQFSNGYSFGLLKSQIPRKNGCTLIEFYPFDIEQGEEKALPDVQSMIVKNEFIKRFSKGEPSSRREIVWFAGRSAKDLPKSMRDTEEGKWMTKEGQFAWIESTFGQAIRAGDEAIAEGMKTYARGQVSKNVLQQMKEINKKSQELLASKALSDDQKGNKET